MINSYDEEVHASFLNVYGKTHVLFLRSIVTTRLTNNAN